MKREFIITIFCCGILFLGGSFLQEANAATFVVTRTDDRNATCNSGVDCSLREALRHASGTIESISIEFSAGFNSPQTITLGSPLSIQQAGYGAITINGKGAHLLTILGNNNGQVFNVSSTYLTLRGL